MKRPAILFSACFTLGIACVLWRGVSFSLLVCLILLSCLCAVLCLGLRQKAAAIVCVAAILLGGLYAVGRDILFDQPRIARIGTSYRQITATAIDYPTIYGEQQRVAVSIPPNACGQRLPIKTLLYFPTRSQSIRPGDSITATVTFYLPTSSDDFDRVTYYRSIGYPVLARAETDYPIFLTAADSLPIRSYPRAVGQLFSQQIRRLFSERDAAFLCALLVGDRSELSDIDGNHLRKAGLSHVIAVSGLHVGFLISLLLLLFGRRVGSAIGIPSLLLFLLMVGATPSVVRACIMYGVVLLSFFLKQEADSVNSLFVALFVCLLWQPAALLSASLQLSFASTLGILCFAGRIQKALLPVRKSGVLLRFFAGSVACSLASLLFTWPILLYHFRYLSVFSPVSNLLALWAVTCVFPLGFLVCIFSLCFTSIATILAIPVSLLCTYIWWIADFFTGLSGGILYAARWIDGILLGVVLLSWCAVVYFAERRWIALSIPILLVGLVGYSYWDSVRTQQAWSMTCLSAGESQAIVVTCGKQAAVIDCGGSGDWKASNSVCEYLDWWGYDHIDLLVVTALDEEHSGSVQDLSERVPVQTVALPESSAKRAEALPDTFGKHRLIVKASDSPMELGATELRLSVLSVDDRLAVRLTPAAETIWIVHSLQPKQLLFLAAEQPMHSTAVVISSAYRNESMESLWEELTPQQIILESGWETVDSISGTPVTCVKQTGDYTKTVPCP